MQLKPKPLRALIKTRTESELLDLYHNLLIYAVKVDDLEEVSDYYQNRGCFNELISLMESGLGLERAHMGIFTELGVLYARYRPEKLMEHIKLFSTRLNIPKLIRVCDEQQHWKELTYLYIQYDEFDNAATTIMNHSPDAWDHMQFKDVAVKVANVELYYKAVHFYLQEHPDLINDLLNVLALRVDHTRVVDIMRKVCIFPEGSCFWVLLLVVIILALLACLAQLDLLPRCCL